MKIAVVGGGIFGCITAIKLRKKFPKAYIVLFERRSGICQEASGINQYRLHLGYHYPRSSHTVRQCQDGVGSFLREYGDCLSPRSLHQYGLATVGSKTSKSEFLRFLKTFDIPCQEVDSSKSILNFDNVDLAIWANEMLIDIKKLKSKLNRQIDRLKIIQIYNTKFEKNDIADYDLVINCSYSNLNCVLDPKEQIDYQFELCEKPVIQLGEEFRNLSCVIIDGPFMCIDPYGNTNYHIMGHVEYAIHHTNIGKFPEIPEIYSKVLNSGIILEKDLENLSKFNKFVKHGKEFFNNFDPIHIGSMFTIRTVLPNRENDDGRPSYITRHSDKLYSVFSGKIGTAVDIANQLIERI